MATSVVKICNNALLDLGQGVIMSLGDNTKAARLCNQRWPSVRDAVLRAHVWNSCTAQTQLAASPGGGTWKWANRYTLPVDFLRVVEVVGSDGHAVEKWEIQGGDLLCDVEAPLYISYVRREEDPRRYDSTLCEALSARLAATLAYPLSGSTALGQAFWASYEQKLSEARGLNAREGGRDQQAQATGTWLAAKLGGGA